MIRETPPFLTVAMRYLVDGYNLMHAIGLVRKGGGQASWERARTDLLHWLADHLSTEQASVVEIIFDAQQTRRGVAPPNVRGLRTTFAYGRTADDVIEERLARDASPTTLTVVSNDQRIRQAALRVGSGVRSCREYVDQLLTPPRSPTPITEEPEKPTTLSDDERDELMRAFGGS